MSTIWLCMFTFLLLINLSHAEEKDDLPHDADLIIDVTKAIPADECKIKSQDGDTLSMHYTGTLYKDGSKFDSSVDRNQPFEFELGAGRVIRGWDQGLLDMCIGEQRTLTIPSDLGYGAQGSGANIPGGATLLFDTQLLNIIRPKPDFTLITYQQFEETKNDVIDIQEKPENEFQIIAFVKKGSKRERLFNNFAAQSKSSPDISFYKIYLVGDDKYRVVMRRNNREIFSDEKVDGKFEITFFGKLSEPKSKKKSRKNWIGSWIEQQRFPFFISSDDPYSFLFKSFEIPKNGIILMRKAVDKNDLVSSVIELRDVYGYMTILTAADYINDNIGFSAGINMLLIHKSIEDMPKLPAGFNGLGRDDQHYLPHAFMQQYRNKYPSRFEHVKKTLKEYRYQWNGEINGDNLKTFITNVLVDKTAKASIHSALSTNQKEDINYEIVTANNFEEIVLDPFYDVLVFYCSESNPDCGSFMNEYNNLAKHVQRYYVDKGIKIKITFLDYYENYVAEKRIITFPTMILYPAKTNKIAKGKLFSMYQQQQYQSGIDDFVDFIDEFATNLNKKEL